MATVVTRRSKRVHQTDDDSSDAMSLSDASMAPPVKHAARTRRPLNDVTNKGAGGRPPATKHQQQTVELTEEVEEEDTHVSTHTTTGQTRMPLVPCFPATHTLNLMNN
jgi:hypothetical protein